MPDIATFFPTFAMVGIVVVLGVSQFNRGVGALLGIGFWIAIAALGIAMYQQGGAIGFPGYPLSQPVFLAMCAVLLALQIVGYRSYRAAVKRREAYQAEREADRGDALAPDDEGD